MDERTPKDYWSLGNQIFFTGGYGWAWNNCCLGKEEDVKQSVLLNKIIDDSLTASQRVILSQVIETERNILYGESGAESLVGASTDRNARNKQTTVRLPTPQKRLSLRPSR